jgi:TonB-dependent SusC/RagA subfamily outer membrane receptor
MIMKTPVKSYQLLLCLFSMAMFFACSGTKNTANSAPERRPGVVDNGYQLVPSDNANQSNIMVHPNRDQPTNMSLTDMMRRLPGVRVQSGRGPYAKIIVDGPSSYLAETDPLFVVNGTAVGTNFSAIYTMISPKDVISLSVLKGADASIYGARGTCGVILIRTQ